MIVKERTAGESNKDYALRVLRDNIIRMELAPGSLLSAQVLANELGVSRTPVREALAELARVGVVETMPQKGTRVALIDYDLVEEARFLRMRLEMGLMDEIEGRIREEDFVWFEANLVMQKFYLENFDQYNLLHLDNEFHEKFFLICGKPHCHEMLRMLGIHFDRVRYASLEDPRDLKTINDHEEIIRAIREKRVEDAKKILSVHLSRFQVDRAKIQLAHQDYLK